VTRAEVRGTLRHVGGVAGVAWHFGRPGWSVAETSRGDREVGNDWCDVLLTADGDDVLLLGEVEPDRFDDLVAALARTGADVTLHAEGREATVTDESRAAGEAAKRERFERDLAALVGLRVLDVTYRDVAYEGAPDPDWDRGDWHHAVMGVELTTDGGVVSLTSTDTFFAYGVEMSRGPLDLSQDGTRGWSAGDHAEWRARRDPVRGVATRWERVELGPGRTSDGTVATPGRAYDVPHAVRLDFEAGPVWFVAAMPEPDGSRPPFVGGDEVMVVFGAERMREMGFGDGTFVAPLA
jgi:hypothetical protein